MSSQPRAASSSFAARLDALDTTLEQVASVPSGSVGDGDVLVGLERLAQMSARLDSTAATLLREAAARGAVQAVGASSVVGWLRGFLRVAPGAAHAQAQLADRLWPWPCATTAASTRPAPLHPTGAKSTT